ncbi:hypothetical protein [Actinomadura sp. KC06]|uniref:hypothetical protein n=1 Tax=Actinomadura sp. KC06 TaxID=2530369 RepID=UPI00140560A5|nr:hypothetical protein [Actinomadura sp. KC06]
MSNSTRWTMVGILIVVNALSNVALRDAWIEIVVSAVTGLAVVALVIDYLVRGRRED